MKSICALARRDDLSRDQFHAYYENHHAPLGIRHFPFVRYVRNHLIDGPDIGFDTISEFWADDIERTAALMQSDIGEIMREDERRFMDQSRIAPASAEEQLLVMRSTFVAERERVAVLIENRDALPIEEFKVRIQRAAAPLAGPDALLAIDFCSAWSAPAFPADAVLWLSAGIDLPEPLTGTILRVLSCETDPQLLQGNCV